jgi:hypothetical protein
VLKKHIFEMSEQYYHWKVACILTVDRNRQIAIEIYVLDICARYMCSIYVLDMLWPNRDSVPFADLLFTSVCTSFLASLDICHLVGRRTL